jgi:hypothetical protein
LELPVLECLDECDSISIKIQDAELAKPPRVTYWSTKDLALFQPQGVRGADVRGAPSGMDAADSAPTWMEGLVASPY